ncbi:DUF6268 family outer membrane beta-barrel protein [Botrimarina hoheduenensis]|nr:DUF6268 family outer membrane beta-barrel protein [Botrimarina hoheduenensis]
MTRHTRRFALFLPFLLWIGSDLAAEPAPTNAISTDDWVGGVSVGDELGQGVPRREEASLLFVTPQVDPVYLPLQHNVAEDAIPNEAPLSGPPSRAPGIPGARRPGFFQGAKTTFEYIPAFDDAGMGHNAWFTSVDIGLPPVLLGCPILISPGYGVHTFEGPTTLQTPAVVHDLQLSFATFRPLTEKWFFRGNVIVGLYGDEHSLDDADAAQISGFAMGIYNLSPAWQWAIGAGYVNNADLAVIPVVGFIHDRGWIKYEAMMPRPRIIVPLANESGVKSNVYVSGEFGGGVWAVQRDSGVTEPLQLSRYAALIGYDRESLGGATWRYELGYVFGRELEYEDSGEAVDLDDSLIVRVGLSF